MNVPRFAITSKHPDLRTSAYHVQADGWKTVASTPDAAWAKFLRQYCPPGGLIPARCDYHIGDPASVELHDASAAVLYGRGYDINGVRKAS